MATILEFQSEARDDNRRVVVSTDNSTAQIIIFPGVRIERYEDDPFEEKSTARERKVLKD